MRSVLSWCCLLGGVLLLAAAGSSLISQFTGQQEARRTVEVSSYQDDSPAPGSVVCQLIVPRFGQELYILEGSTESIFKNGPGHLEHTPLPGSPGNSVIAGHRDTHFRFLKDIEEGDTIWVERRDARHLYRVTGVSIFTPSDTRSLEPTTTPTLTLVTCYPFHYLGSAPKRFVVQATLVDTFLPVRSQTAVR